MNNKEKAFGIFGEPYIVNAHAKIDGKIKETQETYIVFASFSEPEMYNNQTYAMALHASTQSMEFFKLKGPLEGEESMDQFNFIDTDEEYSYVAETFEILFKTLKRTMDNQPGIIFIPEYIRIEDEGLVIEMPSLNSSNSDTSKLH